MGVGSTRDEQPYLYNGKESINDLDLGWYDYGARMYDASLGRWHVQDMMIEKHYDASPYTCVYNNPILSIDPFGLDTFIVNRKGFFIRHGDASETDVLIAGKGDGFEIKRKERGKNKGKMKNKKLDGLKKGTLKPETEDGKGTMLNFENASDAKAVFEFVADNTNVEFSKVVYENVRSSVQSFLTTSHQEAADPYGTHQTTDVQENGGSIISHAHNHPSSIEYGYMPSSEERNGDIAAYKMWQGNQGRTIKFYIRQYNTTREFTKDGTEVRP